MSSCIECDFLISSYSSSPSLISRVFPVILKNNLNKYQGKHVESEGRRMEQRNQRRRKIRDDKEGRERGEGRKRSKELRKNKNIPLIEGDEVEEEEIERGEGGGD